MQSFLPCRVWPAARSERGPKQAKCDRLERCPLSHREGFTAFGSLDPGWTAPAEDALVGSLLVLGGTVESRLRDGEEESTALD